MAVGISGNGFTGGGDGYSGHRRAVRSAPNQAAERSCPCLEVRVVIWHGELVGFIRLELVERRRISLHRDGIRGWLERDDAQPSISAMGKSLIVGEDLVYQIAAVGDITAMRGLTMSEMAAQNHNYIGELSQRLP